MFVKALSGSSATEPSRGQTQADGARPDDHAVQAQLLELLDGFATIVWQADPGSLRVCAVNPQAEAALGYDRQRWLDEPEFLLARVPSADRERFRSCCDVVAATSQPAGLDHGFIAADGAERTMHTRLQIVADPIGGGKRLWGLMVDVTARLVAARAELEELRTAERRRATLVAGVLHELRTPLHHIKGYATTLLRPQLYFDESIRDEYLRVIVDESNHLHVLLKDLLDIAHLDTGTLQLSIDAVQLDDLLRRVVGQWDDAGTHRFTLSVPRSLPSVPGDWYRLKQVFDNVVGNVVRHTPPGTSATVTVKARREDVEIMIADTGPGMSAAELAHVFEPFYRGTWPRRSGVQGSGLGLCISKGIIEQHGGSIALESSPGFGTVFRIRIPRRLRKRPAG